MLIYFKYFFMLLTILEFGVSTAFATPSSEESIHYEISPITKDSISKLKIITTFQPNKNGTTKLWYKDQSWGQDSLYNLLTNLRVLDVKGRVEVNRDSNWIEIQHPKNLNTLSVQYQLQSDLKGDLSTQKAFRPIIEKNYFHVFSTKLFVIPKAHDKNETDKIQVSIGWKDFPKDYVIHNSFGSNKRHQNLGQLTIGAFQSAVFVGGDFRIYPMEIQDNKVYFAIRDSWISFQDSTILNILKQTFQVQRDFWEDHSQEYFTVTMIPTIQEHGSSFLGTGLTNSFALCASNNKNLELEGLVYLFNHELQHNWTGQIIKNENEEEQYWFSEGFTDYYTWKNIASNEINDLGADYFINKLNECIRLLYTSPVKTAPNQDINYDNFWSSRDYEKLPYRRGALFAFYLDMSIRKASQDTKSLDHVMRQFKKDALEKDQYINHAYFLKIAQQYMDAGVIQSFFDQHIEQGKLMDLAKMFQQFGLGFDKNSEVFDLGFQMSDDKKFILSVDKMSKAYQEGLRTGDQLMSRSIYYGSLKHPVEISVKREDEKYDFSFIASKIAPIAQIKNTEANRSILFPRKN